jgi:hypothetical protein
LARHRDLARRALNARAGTPAERHAHPLLQVLSQDEFETLTAVQYRLLDRLVHDPEGYRRAGYFNCMTFLFLKSRKPE